MSEDAHTLPLDSSNQFGVGVCHNGAVVIHGLCAKSVIDRDYFVMAALTREQALNLAAWLSVLADPGGKDFARLVEEIKKT